MNLLAYVHLRNIHGSTGAGRVARQITEHLARRPGIRLEILADRADHRRIVDQVGAPWTEYCYHLFDQDTSRQQARWFFLGSPRAEHYWPEADVVYCTGESYVPTRRARLAVTLHDAAIFEEGPHRFGAAALRQRLKWRLLYRTLDRRADLFHTVSHFSAERIAHFFPSLRNRLRVVHNAVPPRFFQPPGEEGCEALRRYGLADRPFVLLPRGLAHRKNAALVLRAWPVLAASYPELKLVVTSHSEPLFAAKADALGASVLRTGFVSDEALCALYSAASLVWFPSLYEGFGLPVLEAMACGTPVVASRSSSLPEVAGNAACLVPPHDAPAHIEAMRYLLEDQRKRAELIAAGRERAAGFTWQASAAQLHTHLQQLV